MRCILGHIWNHIEGAFIVLFSLRFEKCNLDLSFHMFKQGVWKEQNKGYSRKMWQIIKIIVCDKYSILYKHKCNVLQFLIKCVCIKCVTHIRFLSSKEANIMQNRSFRFERFKTYKTLQSAFKKNIQTFSFALKPQF